MQDLDTLADFNNLRQASNYEQAKRKINEALFPCLADPHSHEFDFWIGEWDVFATGTNKLVGHSLVQSISGGCGLLENWTSVQKSTGKSINYFDPAEGKWRQDWLSSTHSIMHYYNGEYKDGAMNFRYEGMNRNGVKVLGNFRFYHVDQNTVR